MWVANGRAFAPPCTRCRIGRLGLDEPAVVELFAHGPRHRRPELGHPACLRVDDQVYITLPDPRLRVRQPIVLVGKRPKRLGRDGEPVGQDGQLTAPGRDDLAFHADVIARGPRPASRPRARPRRPGRARASPGCPRCRRGWWRSTASRAMRDSITRPVTPTCSPVAVSAARSGYRARTSAIVLVRGKSTG